VIEHRRVPRAISLAMRQSASGAICRASVGEKGVEMLLGLPTDTFIIICFSVAAVLLVVWLRRQ
jgi:branched-subunit amino acid ABC-type transport system permease component